MSKYNNRIKRVQNRLNPERIQIFDNILFSDLSDAPTDVLKYIKSAMKGVEPEYTAKSKVAGEKVKQHLKDGGLSNVSFKYQGSVMTDTHIKGASDIDLLTICDKFYTYDSHTVYKILDNKRSYPYDNSQLQKLQHELEIPAYRGDAINDLMITRNHCERILKETYQKCDITPPKAIKITNSSLRRDVDVVVANWYDNVDSIINDKEIDYRGIQVFDKSTNQKCSADFPFLSIKRINERSCETNGRLKKMIRFLKNIKEDSDMQIELSSFDINAICYSMNTLQYKNMDYVELVIQLYDYICEILGDNLVAKNIRSVDGKEFIFNGNPQKIYELLKIENEINEIINDLKA